MKRIVVSGAVLALAIGGVQVATAAPAGEKVTGGGQILADSQTTGAGSTIAFTAQESATDVKGQVQYIIRTGGTGKGQNVRHGVVDCVNVISPGDGGSAKIGGYFDNDPTQTFVIDVVDNGEGAKATGLDMIAIREGAASDGNDSDSDGSCNDSDDFAADFALGRGNVQVHKAK